MKNVTLIVALLTVAAGTTKMVQAQETFDLATLSCFDVLSLPEDDSLFVTALLLGHVLGQAGTSESSAELIQSAVEGFDATCGDSPDMTALEAMTSNL